MKELWIDLQPDSPHALYEQIYEYIRKDIADGKISPGKNYRLLVLWQKSANQQEYRGTGI